MDVGKAPEAGPDSAKKTSPREPCRRRTIFHGAGNKILVIAGTLHGASGLILSIIMCKAMNHPFTNVLIGAFGKAPVVVVEAGKGNGFDFSRNPDRTVKYDGSEQVVNL